MESLEIEIQYHQMGLTPVTLPHLTTRVYKKYTMQYKKYTMQLSVQPFAVTAGGNQLVSRGEWMVAPQRLLQTVARGKLRSIYLALT